MGTRSSSTLTIDGETVLEYEQASAGRSEMPTPSELVAEEGGNAEMLERGRFR